MVGNVLFFEGLIELNLHGGELEILVTAKLFIKGLSHAATTSS
jgi:hypothetical protein